MLLGALGANFCESSEARTGSNKSQWRNDKGRTGFLMSPHLLTRFGTQKYYKNDAETRFNGDIHEII